LSHAAQKQNRPDHRLDSHIGLAASRAFACEGAIVIVHSRHEASLPDTKYSSIVTNEIALCWQTGAAPQTIVKIEKNGKHYAPVSLRSTHWTTYSVDVNRHNGLSLALPRRIAFVCDQAIMLVGKIPMSGLSNDYY